MARNPKQYDDDDGRVICNMDIEGMRWHDRRIRREDREMRRASVQQGGDQLTKSEARRYTFYAVLAGLTIVLVYSVIWVVFTLFLTKVWFR